MAGDTIDGCLPSKMAPQEDMETSSQQSSVSVLSPGGTQGSEQASSQSQQATQPLEFSQEPLPASQGLEDGVWGQLYPHCGTFPRIPLKSDKYSLGRAGSCDYSIKVSDMGGLKWMQAVSKVQCEIIKTDKGVFLKDCSSNGTWVNGIKVGKDKMWPLEHNAEICFSYVYKKVFVFMSNEVVDDTFPEELTSRYTISKVLGTGATGQVRLAFRIPDLHRVAIKIICKKTVSSTFTSRETVMNEVRILQSVNHPSVIKLEDVIDTTDYLFIVLELAEGGELFDKIIEKSKLDETVAKLYFYQIASAIKYLHSKNICHRDLKPENVLLCSVDDNNPVVKITDMGLSKLVDQTILKTYCGTPQYIAPEVLKGSGLRERLYTFKVDCWALGVILFILLSGSPPFSEDKKTGQSLRDQILNANFVFYPKLFESISNDAKDLIKKLLIVNPEERIGSEQILQHPWLQDNDVIMKARDLMYPKGKKRLAEEIDSVDNTEEKRVKVFKEPLLGNIFSDK